MVKIDHVVYGGVQGQRKKMRVCTMQLIMLLKVVMIWRMDAMYILRNLVFVWKIYWWQGCVLPAYKIQGCFSCYCGINRWIVVLLIWLSRRFIDHYKTMLEWRKRRLCIDIFCQSSMTIVSLFLLRRNKKRKIIISNQVYQFFVYLYLDLEYSYMHYIH